MFSCPHPRDSSYLFQLGISHPEKGETHPVLWEIRALDNNSFSPTWLIQNTVQHSNPVYFITRFNPLYLYLPYLTLHQDELLPINDVLRSISYPSAPGLPVCAFEQICTVKDNDRIQIHEAKTLRWLRQTVDRVQVKIAQKKKTTMSESDLQSALHCIGEYLPPVWYEKLCQDLKYVRETIEQLRCNLTRPPPLLIVASHLFRSFKRPRSSRRTFIRWKKISIDSIIARILQHLRPSHARSEKHLILESQAEPRKKDQTFQWNLSRLSFTRKPILRIARATFSIESFYVLRERTCASTTLYFKMVMKMGIEVFISGGLFP